jgi:hypothetical protein
MDLKSNKGARYLKAKKRVSELKGYYWHLVTYILVNLFITITQIIEGVDEGKSYPIIFSDFGVYGVWVIWGISLFFHTLKTFRVYSLFGKNWEENKLKEIMDKDELTNRLDGFKK